MGAKRDRSSQVYFFHSFQDSLWKLLCMLKYMAEQEWSRGEVSVLNLEPLNYNKTDGGNEWVGARSPELALDIHGGDRKGN